MSWPLTTLLKPIWPRGMSPFLPTTATTWLLPFLPPWPSYYFSYRNQRKMGLPSSFSHNSGVWVHFYEDLSKGVKRICLRGLRGGLVKGCFSPPSGNFAGAPAGSGLIVFTLLAHGGATCKEQESLSLQSLGLDPNANIYSSITLGNFLNNSQSIC